MLRIGRQIFKLIDVLSQVLEKLKDFESGLLLTLGNPRELLSLLLGVHN